jgi:hypothetical protein
MRVTDALETRYTRAADGTGLAHQLSGAGPLQLVLLLAPPIVRNRGHEVKRPATIAKRMCDLAPPPCRGHRPSMMTHVNEDQGAND